MAIDKQEIIEQLNQTLAPFNYDQDKEISIPDVWYISYVGKKNVLKIRNLCAVISISQNTIDTNMAKKLFEYIRSKLLKKYGDAILWKELEIVFVVLCHTQIFKALQENEGRDIDQIGFSMSSMLGSLFINTETFEYFGHSNWGIYFSSEHYKAVTKDLSAWCEQKKKLS